MSAIVANRSRSGTGGDAACSGSMFVLIVAEYMSECPIVARPKRSLTANDPPCRVDSQTIIRNCCGRRFGSRRFVREEERAVQLITDVVLPQMGLEVAEGVVLALPVEVGQSVAEGDVIAEV